MILRDGQLDVAVVPIRPKYFIFYFLNFLNVLSIAHKKKKSRIVMEKMQVV